MMGRSRSPYFLLTVVFMLALSACGSPEAVAPTLDMNAVFTQVAGTLAMEYTQTALAMPLPTDTPEPTLTPLETPTLQPAIVTTPIPTITPTYGGVAPLYLNPATAYGCYNAALVSDVTIPSGTKFKPGDSFTKTWRLINTGTCDWTADFKITYVGGNLFGSDTTKIRQRVAVGNTGDISLDMVAPSGSSGTVVSNWQMATDDGNLFGSVLTVSIVLPGSNPTATAIDCYNATLLSNVSIPNGTKLDAGEAFTKTWLIENSGTCDWTGDFKITFVGGNLFGSDTTKIRKRVLSGNSIEISLDMVAPSTTGTVSSSWQMANDNGNLFGQVFTFEIVVK